MEKATLTCPKCGHKQGEEMPTNACIPFYVCKQCGEMITPKEGDCCVFCSYGDRLCPVSVKSKKY